ncbi:MAG: carbonic anhydrase [Frankiales bacterium]|nr:carbonic anhydrase [Frankiales bacterium]
MTADKQRARRVLQAARDARSEADRHRAGAALADTLEPLVRAARRVASYVSIGTEPPTTALNALRDDVLLPVLLPDGDLDWATGPLVPGPHGLLEPSGPRQGPAVLADCDLVLVPALAADRAGTRLGRGGGSYDRALARTSARTVACLYDGELLDALPREDHDVPVRAAVTPAGGLVQLGWHDDRVGSFDDVLTANALFQQQFHDEGLEGRAARGLAVVTCMDSRIDPLRMLGLLPGDAKILRTAGARVTDDVLRSLVLAHHLLGVDRVMVVPHTDCGMTKADDDEVHRRIAEETGIDSRSVDFHTIRDQQAVLRHDVQRVRSSPYLASGLPVIGAVYDVHSGRLDVAVGVDD